MQTLRPTRHRFDYEKAQFDPDAYFADSFGVYVSGGKPRRIVVDFTGWAAQIVAEKHWHATQKLTRRRDGSLRFEAKVAHLDDVVPWVLSSDCGASRALPANRVDV